MVFPWMVRPPTTEPTPPVYGPPAPDHVPPAPHAAEPAPVVAKKSGPADPSAMLPYVDAHAPVDPHIKEAVDNAKALSMGFQLATYSHDMGGAGGKAFLNTLDQITDPALRQKVMGQYQTMTGQSLESFIQGNTEWNNDGAHRDKDAALALISDKRGKVETDIAALPKDEREKKEKAANDYAIQILASTTAHDHSDANMQKLFGALGGRDPMEIEMIRQAVSKHTNGESNLYSTIDNGTHKGDEDEAVAMLAGDRVASARAAIQNETDPKRLREVMSGLDAKQLAELKMGYGPLAGVAFASVTNPTDRAELDKLMNGDHAGANAERLANLLKPREEGFLGPMDPIGQDNYDRRKPANVIKEFESMSGEDVQAAAQAWNKSHPERSFESMLQERWGNDEDKTEYNRLHAMLEGDKGKNRSLRLQEGLRTHNQQEIEAALAHQPTSDASLQSTDPAVRAKAESIAKENASFEQHNISADQISNRVSAFLGGGNDIDAAGRSTKDQLDAHYAKREQERVGAPTAAWDIQLPEEFRADVQAKHDEQVAIDRVGANDLLEKGKLSTASEVRRAKTTKEKAELLDGVETNAELDEAQAAYRKHFHKDMFEVPEDRSDLNANQLALDNLRRYGAKSERPAQLEYLLQLQQYELQHSAALERDEMTEAGGGTQTWQRQELAAERNMLKDPKLQSAGPNFGGPNFLDPDHQEPTFDAIEKLLPAGSAGQDDGLKDGVTKRDFTLQDKGLSEANKSQEVAKKRMADRIVKVISTVAKIASALTMNPALIALVDLSSSLIEMGVKHEVMGEAYDPAEDMKMMAITGVADVALMGFSSLGKAKGAATLVEHEAMAVGERTALEMEQAVTSEAKTEVMSEGAHAVAGESTALAGAIEEGTAGATAIGSETAGAVGREVEQKAAGIAEGTALHEGESAAAGVAASETEKTTLEVGEGAAKEALSPAQIAANLEKRYGLYGQAAKHVVSTIGGGIAQGRSPADVMQSLVTGGLGLVLPGALSEKLSATIGNESVAQKILGEVFGTATEYTTGVALAAAGGADGGDAAIDTLIGVAGSKVQHASAAHAARQTSTESTTHSETAPAEPTPAESVAPPAEFLVDAPANSRSAQVADSAPAAPRRVTERGVGVTGPATEAATDAAAGTRELPVHERPTERNIAVPEPAQSVREQIERTTGVEKGADYDAFRSDMAEMYANQNIEGQNVTRVEGEHFDAAVDPKKNVHWKSGFDKREFTYDNGNLTHLTVDAYLNPSPGSEAVIDNVKNIAFRGVDRVVNSPLHKLPNDNRLQYEPNFVDTPLAADVSVDVMPGRAGQNGEFLDTNMTRWMLPDIQSPKYGPEAAAHELLHPLGLGDEYQSRDFWERLTNGSPRVATDNSIMGNFVRDPGMAEIKPRHLDYIGRRIDEAEGVFSRTASNDAGTTAQMPVAADPSAAITQQMPVATAASSAITQQMPVATPASAAITQQMPVVTAGDPGQQLPSSSGTDTSPAGPKTRGVPEAQLTDVGRHAPTSLTPRELHQVLAAEQARNKYLKAARERPPTDFPNATQRNLGASDNGIRDHLAPDDLAGNLKEARGVQIPDGRGGVHDHQTEVAEASDGVITTMESLKDRLKALTDRGAGEPGEVDTIRQHLSQLSKLLDAIRGR